MQETYQQSAQDVLTSLHSSPSGLTAEEAAARLDRHGPNKLQEAPKATLLQRFFQQILLRFRQIVFQLYLFFLAFRK